MLLSQRRFEVFEVVFVELKLGAVLATHDPDIVVGVERPELPHPARSAALDPLLGAVLAVLDLDPDLGSFGRRFDTEVLVPACDFHVVRENHQNIKKHGRARVHRGVGWSKFRRPERFFSRVSCLAR